MILIYLLFAFFTRQNSQAYECFKKQQFPKFIWDPTSTQDSYITSIQHFPNSLNFIFGGSINGQPVIGKYMQQQYYNSISWMNIYQSRDPSRGNLKSVESMALHSSTLRIAIVFKGLNSQGDPIYVNSVMRPGGTSYLEAVHIDNTIVFTHQLRQQIVFNDEAEATFMYYNDLNTFSMIKLNTNANDQRWTCRLVKNSPESFFIRALWSLDTQSRMWFGGKRRLTSENHLVIGVIESYGWQVNYEKIFGINLQDCTSNCNSLSVNLLYSVSQDIAFGCLSNEYLEPGELHAFGYIAIDVTDNSQRTVFIKHAIDGNTEYYCSGIHQRQSNNSLAIYITEVNNVSKERSLLQVHVPDSSIFSPSTTITKQFDVLRLVYASAFKPNYMHYNYIDYYYDSSRKLDISFMAGYIIEPNKSKKAFLFVDDPDQQQLSLGNLELENAPIAMKFIKGPYQSINIDRIANLTLNLSVEYEIVEDAKLYLQKTYLLPEILPGQGLMPFLILNKNEFDCYIGMPCEIYLGIFTLENCLDGVDSIMDIIMLDYPTQMYQSQYIAASNPKVLPHNFTFSFIPTASMFAMQHREYDLRVNSTFDYIYDSIDPKFLVSSFKVRVWDECTKNIDTIYSQDDTQQYTFILGQWMQYIQIPKLNSSLAGCDTINYFDFSYNNQTDFPDLIVINFNQQSPVHYFQVYTTDPKTVGTYVINVTANFRKPYGTVAYYNFNITLIVKKSEFKAGNIAPYYTSRLKNITVQTGQSLILKLPKSQDDNGDNITTQFQMGTAILFIDTSTEGAFNIKPSKQFIGEYIISIILKDDNPTIPLSTTYKIGIIVVDKDKFMNGFINITEEELFAQQTKFIGDIRAKIQRVDYKGEMLIIFDTDIKTPPFYQERLNTSLLIQLIQNNKKIKTNYSISTMKGNQMKIQLSFDNPSNVSTKQVRYRCDFVNFIFKEWDTIGVTFVKNYFYVGVNKQVIVQQNLYITKPVPPQLSSGNIKDKIIFQFRSQKAFRRDGFRIISFTYSIYGEQSSSKLAIVLFIVDFNLIIGVRVCNSCGE
eukprot:403370809